MMDAAFNASEWLVDRHIAEGNADRVAIRTAGQTLTYADVQAEVLATASALRALGVRPEERVAMAMLDSVEFVATFLGAMRIGAIPLLMNPLLPGRDLGVIVADSRARVVMVSAEKADAIDALRVGAPEVETVISTGAWADFLAAGTGDDAMYATTEESPGFWLCTSGSTGRPKLAMHRHGDIKVTCDNYAQRVLGITASDVCFSVGPMFHAYGLGNSLTFPFSVGATTVLEPTRPPTPDLVAGIVRQHEVSLFFCIPTFYAALNGSDLADDTFASVRFGVSAAESLPAESFERFRRRFGVTILDGIGSTEILHIYLSNLPTKYRAGTSGVPVPGYEARIVDELDRDQPDGEPGQLLVSGESTALGYWCRSEQTRSTFDGRWLRTGDLYVRDSDGFYTYLGRVDDMLRVGGEWVSPAEVEGTLIEHPTVREAAVVGERDDDDILRPVAYVIGETGATPDAETLTAFCRERLAGYKRPKRYVMVDELPKTATGKIQRFKLRQ